MYNKAKSIILLMMISVIITLYRAHVDGDEDNIEKKMTKIKS